MVPYHVTLTQRGSRYIFLILIRLGALSLLIKFECQIEPFANLTVLQVVNKFLVFYRRQSFITVFTRAHHWFLS
jgi:hypothetical protein